MIKIERIGQIDPIFSELQNLPLIFRVCFPPHFSTTTTSFSNFQLNLVKATYKSNRLWRISHLSKKWKSIYSGKSLNFQISALLKKTTIKVINPDLFRTPKKFRKFQEISWIHFSRDLDDWSKIDSNWLYGNIPNVK